MMKKLQRSPLLLLLFFWACKSPQPARPEEFYDAVSLEPEPSVIQIPVKIFKSELQQSINQRLGNLLYEDKNLADDGLMLKATRRENVTLDLDNQQIKYRVPLNLWVKKDLTITDVEAEGSLALEFSTRYNIKPDWSLETKTEVTGYKWIQQPVVKLGFADLPVTSIANLVLNQTKQQLSKGIDEQVAGLFDLKKEIETAWKEMHDPVLISEEYKTWLLLNPQSISMTPLKGNGNVVESTVIVTSKPTISLGEKPATPQVIKLPPFQFGSVNGDDFTMYLSTAIPFSEAERLSRQNMKGEVFTYGKKQVKVEDIELFGQGNKLVVNTKLSGSYNGDVYFTGKPVFNAEKNKIELQDVDFDFSTQKALLKTASWLFKGTLKKKVQENLDFYLKYNLDDTKKLIQQQLDSYQIAPGIAMKGNLEELNLSHIYLDTEAIRVRVGLKGKLNLEVKGL